MRYGCHHQSVRISKELICELEELPSLLNISVSFMQDFDILLLPPRNYPCNLGHYEVKAQGGCGSGIGSINLIEVTGFFLVAIFTFSFFFADVNYKSEETHAKPFPSNQLHFRFLFHLHSNSSWRSDLIPSRLLP